MSTDASASLVTAIKNSLADAGKGWRVVSRSERKEVASVSGSVSGGGGTVTNGNGTISSASGSVTSTERIRTTIALLATGLIHGAGPMRMRYTEVKEGGSFVEGYVQIGDGAELRTTDAALNATVTGMASSYSAAEDAALIAAFSASDPKDMPAGVIADLIDSLADPLKGWRVTADTETEFAGQPPGRIRCVALFSPVVKMGGLAGIINYVETTSIDGAFLAATVHSGGLVWRTDDAALRSAILAKGAAFSATRANDVAAGLS